MSKKNNERLKQLQKLREQIQQSTYPAFDDLILYSLERRHLDIPEFSDILIQENEMVGLSSLQEHLKNNVRLFKIDEISFDKNEVFHLPSVENAITSMYGRGHSLLFIVQGDVFNTSVFLGLSKFSAVAFDINASMEGYRATWEANFPGSSLDNLSNDEISGVSYNIASCKEFGVLTGIPSLKRKEESNSFVQGLERLIRAMRGKTYTWISIADPIPTESVRNAIDNCQKLQADIHHLVRTNLSEATSKGKTIMLGMFGMLGQGTTDSKSHTISEAITKTDSYSHTQQRLETYQRAGSVATPILGVAGALIGTMFLPGLGTAIGAAAGQMLGGTVNSLGAAITGKSGYAESHTNSTALTRSFADTTSQALSNQLAGGGFGSFGLSWTKTMTIGQELLNRKAEYVEEVLQIYEKRLQEGTALGMWNLGHFFCAADEDTFNRGSGIITSLFSGMDSIYEPPRAIKMPENFCSTLRRFNNIYLRFSDENITVESLKSGKVFFQDHPLGIFFNGPGTPVNTAELAIATPVTTQDIEGVTVSQRAAFAINVPMHRQNQESVTLGNILDKGNQIKQRYRLSLSSLPKHLAIFGLTGSGKTNTVHNLLMQIWQKHRIPFLVIEPAKAEYRKLGQTDELKDDLLVISAGINQTSVCPLRLNPFDFDPGKDNDLNRIHLLTHIDRLKATFNASFPMYASMPYILEEAIIEIYRERGWDLGRSLNRFVDIYNENFKDFIPTLRDLYLKVDSVVQRKGYFKEQQMNIQAALKARLSSLMVGAKGEMFNCQQSIFTKDLFDRPVVIELENIGDDDEKAFLMGLLVSKLYEYRKANFAPNGNETAPLFNHVLVIEEAHRLLANIPDTSSNMESANVKGKSVSTFVDMLSEIRAFGQSVFIIDQLPSRVSPNIVKGTGSKIIHRLLAKDDRESVGWTMGLDENQIDDLCLLRTGESIISQDGDRKSFMCKINKATFADNYTDSEILKGTVEFKEANKSLFKQFSGYVDLEDVSFLEELHKTMLTIGIGQTPQNISILTKENEEKLLLYWEQICRDIWSFYGGDYKCYLSLYKDGIFLLKNVDFSLDKYRSSFNSYFKNTRVYSCIASNSITAVAFEQLFLRHEILVSINRNFDLIKTCPDKTTRLALAIKKILPLLLPTTGKIDSDVIEQVVSEILFLVSPRLSVPKIIKAGSLI